MFSKVNKRNEKNAASTDQPLLLIALCWLVLCGVLVFSALYVDDVIAQERALTSTPSTAPVPGTVQRVTYKCGTLLGQGLVTIYIEPEADKPATALIAVIDCRGNPA
jgi:hypothetical protein